MNGIVKIGDFGLATFTTSTRNFAKTVTGTQTHIAPELYQDLEYDSKADMWAMGVILYELISGKLPFFGQSIASLQYKILHTQPDPLPDNYSRDLKNICGALLDKDREDVPQQRISSRTSSFGRE